MSDKNHFITASVGEIVVLQTENGQSVYIVDTQNDRWLWHASIAKPYETEEELKEAFAVFISEILKGNEAPK